MRTFCKVCSPIRLQYKQRAIFLNSFSRPSSPAILRHHAGRNLNCCIRRAWPILDVRTTNSFNIAVRTLKNLGLDSMTFDVTVSPSFQMSSFQSFTLCKGVFVFIIASLSSLARSERAGPIACIAKNNQIIVFHFVSSQNFNSLVECILESNLCQFKFRKS